MLMLAIFVLPGIATGLASDVHHAEAQSDCHSRNTWQVDLDYQNHHTERFSRFELNSTICFQLNTSWRTSYVYFEMHSQDLVVIEYSEHEDVWLSTVVAAGGEDPIPLLLPIEEHGTLRLVENNPVIIDSITFSIRGADETSAPFEDTSNDGLTVIPNAGFNYVFTLRGYNDHILMPFVACPGETQIYISGVRNRSDIAIGVQNPEDEFTWAQSRDLEWNSSSNRLLRTLHISRSDLGDYRWWRAYAVNATDGVVRAEMWVVPPPNC